KKADAACLVARQVLVDDAPASQYKRIFAVRLFIGTFIFDRVKFRLAVRMIELFFEKPGSSGMVLGRTRPEDPVICINLFIANAVVIRLATFGSDPQLVKDLAR